MKLKYVLPLFLLFTFSMFGQVDKEKREQVKALKVSFLTTELNLTSDEAEKFWPVYNSYEQKFFALKHGKMRPLIKRIDAVANMTDKEALNYLDQLQEIEKELFDVRQKLVTDLKPILSPVKILKLKKAEDDFNKKLLSKYKDGKK